MDEFNETLQDLRIAHYKFVFGDPETGAPGALKINSKLEYLLFQVPCTLPGNASCKGFDMMIKEFLR